jgi:hypothetical protein
VNYLDKKYELNVSMHQLAVLLAFNDSDTFTVQSLQNLTNSNEGELLRVLKVC